MKTGKIEFAPDYKSEKSASLALNSIKRFKQNNPPDDYLSDQTITALSWKIFEVLREKGCEIGNASVPIIAKTIQEFLKEVPTIPTETPAREGTGVNHD